jgi:hypothetical protein
MPKPNLERARCETSRVISSRCFPMQAISARALKESQVIVMVRPFSSSRQISESIRVLMLDASPLRSSKATQSKRGLTNKSSRYLSPCGSIRNSQVNLTKLRGLMPNFLNNPPMDPWSFTTGGNLDSGCKQDRTAAIPITANWAINKLPKLTAKAPSSPRLRAATKATFRSPLYLSSALWAEERKGAFGRMGVAKGSWPRRIERSIRYVNARPRRTVLRGAGVLGCKHDREACWQTV